MQLSIVIPVYNVKKYISKCIESIIDQTNKQFELILVDDGSTDSSGEICDSYAKKNNFIKVYHIDNCGPGGARNYGVKKASGDYIFFVDSDDYIAREVVEILHRLNSTNKSDIIVVAEAIVPEEKQIIESLNVRDVVNGIEEYTNEQAIELLGYVKKMLSAPWGKMIKKDILINRPFPENVIYEDYEEMYQIFELANKIVYVPAKLYYYVQRVGSIMHSQWNEQRYRLMEISKSFMNWTKKKHPDIYAAAVYRYFFSLNELCVFAMSEKGYVELTKEARVYARKIKGQLITDRNVKFLTKIRYMIMIYFPRMYKNIWEKGKRIIRKIKGSTW